VVRPKFYAERDILLAEGGSLIEARDVPSVGASSWISVSGRTGPRCMRSGWPLFRRLSLVPRNLSPPPSLSIAEGCTPAHGVAAFRVLVDEGRRVPGVVVRGKLDSQGKRRYSPPTSPLTTAWCCAPGWEGGE
jgi:hypothetical protein